MRGPACSRLDAVRAAAARAGCAVLLKGPDTVIAAPDGTAAVHGAVYDRSAPWLATAGAGDVLAGLIAGLLARGQGAVAAAEAAAWLHVEAARRVGPGLIAEDLPEALPGVLRSAAIAKVCCTGSLGAQRRGPQGRAGRRRRRRPPCRQACALITSSPSA